MEEVQNLQDLRPFLAFSSLPYKIQDLFEQSISGYEWPDCLPSFGVACLHDKLACIEVKH